ncbi:MAG: aspartate kinase, partial [Polyangiaceae bacterium]
MGMIIVQKYGGSSMADVAKIGLVADKVARAKRAGHDVVVVVSAMGKTTDELVALARKIASAEGAGLDHATASPPRRELDMLVSTGERVSMALLSIAIQARGLEAISFTGSQAGIITTDRHFDARIIAVRPQRILDELAKDRVVIVAGYQGVSEKKEITTLGRGGSDTTAVALAAALDAVRCEIYSDVDGVYSADPRVVDDPVHLPVLDLATLQEMAEAGAKVINAQAVEWARRAKITIHARKTTDFEASARETVATESPPLGRVRAVVGLDNVVQVRLRGGFRRFLDLAATLEAPLVDIAGTSDDATCVLPLLNVPDWERCRAR